MSLDAALQEALEPLHEQIRRLEGDIRELRRTVAARYGEQPVYNAKQLQEILGYSKTEGYAILNEYGSKQNGRLRITSEQLMDYHKRTRT